MKTCLYNVVYIVKRVYRGIYYFLISAQKHRLWVLVRTASTTYVLSRHMKNIRIFVSENFQFLEVKVSIYLNRRVFIMVLDAIDGKLCLLPNR